MAHPLWSEAFEWGPYVSSLILEAPLVLSLHRKWKVLIESRFKSLGKELICLHVLEKSSGDCLKDGPEIYQGIKAMIVS